MEKETVIAKVRATLSFTNEARRWLGRQHGSWIAEEEGNTFLREFSGTWSQIFTEELERAAAEFFTNLGLSPNIKPRLRLYESYPGSWIIDAALVLPGSIAAAYMTLKAISEFPDIADGLTSLGKRLKNEIKCPFNDKAVEALRNAQNIESSPPANLLDVDLLIDARPILALTPAPSRSHAVHLSVGISRDALTIENLGDTPIRDLRLGLFKSQTRRNQWSFWDAFSGGVSILSPRQTLVRDIGDFQHANGSRFTLDEPSRLYVDCWLQDEAGIYLFLFELD